MSKLKTKAAAGVFMSAFLFLAGCSQEGGDGTIVIDDRVFVNQILSMLMDPEEFTGQTVRYEGAFRTFLSSITGNHHSMVYRLMVCCDPLGEPIGFILDMGEWEVFPDEAWVEVTGVLEVYDGFSFRTLRLEVSGIREAPPGNMFVR